MNDNFDSIVIVDPGKNEVKCFYFDNNYNLEAVYSFPSKFIQKINFADIDYSSPLQFKVQYGGKKYLIGEGVSTSFNFKTTKNNFHHKLCIYTAIANVIKKENEKVHLVIGYPSSDYVNEAQREKYIQMIKDDENIEMNVNGENKSFIIEDVVVLAEGIGFAPRIKNPKKHVHIVDIGGQNVNYREYDLLGNTINSFSLDKVGTNHLESHIKNELRKYINAEKYSVEAIDITACIKKKTIKDVDALDGFDDVSDFMEYATSTFIENKLIPELISKGANLTQTGHLIIFTGGGSMLLQPYLQEVLSQNSNLYFSTTARWDNCISYVIKDLANRGRTNNKNIEKLKFFRDKILNQVTLANFDVINNPFFGDIN